MEQEIGTIPGNLTPEEWEQNKRGLALFKRWAEEDASEPEEDEETWLRLKQALEEDHPSSRSLFGSNKD